MNKTFITSDIHGHLEVLKESLNKAGFNKNNKKHHLLVLGDMFDRGTESKQVFEYLYELSMDKKATIIRGNHDQFLMDFLEGNFNRTSFNIEKNGFGKTLDSFLGFAHNSDDNFSKNQEVINQKFPQLLPWLKNTELYIEADKYIFVHGGINPNQDDWRKSSIRDFVWTKEYEQDPIPGKIVVAGHHRNATINRKECKDYKGLFISNKELFDIIYLEGKILIDRFVEVSNELNVLVLDIDIT